MPTPNKKLRAFINVQWAQDIPCKPLSKSAHAFQNAYSCRDAQAQRIDRQTKNFIGCFNARIKTINVPWWPELASVIVFMFLVRKKAKSIIRYQCHARSSLLWITTNKKFKYLENWVSYRFFNEVPQSPFRSNSKFLNKLFIKTNQVRIFEIFC